jgi:hypothetical protein
VALQKYAILGNFLSFTVTYASFAITFTKIYRFELFFFAFAIFVLMEMFRLEWYIRESRLNPGS